MQKKEIFSLSKKQIRKLTKNDPVIRDVVRLFFDKANRPKITPLHLSVIHRKMEEKYHSWYVNEALKKLKKKKILSYQVARTDSIRRITFFYPSIFDAEQSKKNQITKKIRKSCMLIEKYSNPKITRTLGKHLHSLIKAELRAQGFTIVKEGRVKSYNNKKWIKTKHDLDMIAENKDRKMAIGLEIKNTLDTISKKEISTKIMICQELDIIPVFACRWLRPYADEIQQKKGFPWQLNTQLYPLGMEELVKAIQKRFQFKVQVRSELPTASIIAFEKWLKHYDKTDMVTGLN
ncbi:MAG TPA: hypothetical protein VFM64_04690 [Candidatus Nitrosotenuis sp.]|nr:hypothetical protein [Candidatus Nitrosotenuis sp.]